MTAGLLAAQVLAEGQGDSPAIDKWQVQRDLGLARSRFGVSDRDLAVLAALISFLREAEIGSEATIVFPSNATLSQRAHGMAESTLRRHLAALVSAGLIQRHDSPNGKRYAVRGQGADLDRAFGFDLSPLARRAEEIALAARAVEQDQARLRRLREGVVLRLRDCQNLVAYALAELPGCWDGFADRVALTRRDLRRKLDHAALMVLDAQVRDLLARINAAVLPVKTEKTDANASPDERHKQDSTKILIDSEPCAEAPGATAERADPEPAEEPALPIHLVLRACPEILTYAAGGIRSWRDLIGAAAHVRGMMGISADAWDEAQHSMTPAVAAISVACILQSFDRIAKPGGYLRALARKSAEGSFSPGPMVMALLKAENARPA